MTVFEVAILIVYVVSIASSIKHLIENILGISEEYDIETPLIQLILAVLTVAAYRYSKSIFSITVCIGIGSYVGYKVYKKSNKN